VTALGPQLGIYSYCATLNRLIIVLLIFANKTQNTLSNVSYSLSIFVDPLIVRFLFLLIFFLWWGRLRLFGLLFRRSRLLFSWFLLFRFFRLFLGLRLFSFLLRCLLFNNWLIFLSLFFFSFLSLFFLFLRLFHQEIVTSMLLLLVFLTFHLIDSRSKVSRISSECDVHHFQEFVHSCDHRLRTSTPWLFGWDTIKHNYFICKIRRHDKVVFNNKSSAFSLHNPALHNPGCNNSLLWI